MLVMFVDIILPKLNLTCLAFQDTPVHVFRKFSGEVISTSMVTSIIRSALLDLGIYYTGTVTYFRRAAATLTEKFNSDLIEKMALFMGHSRRVHDKYSRVQLGHHGLVDAFEKLENMQNNLYSEDIFEEVNHSPSPIIEYLQTSNAKSAVSLSVSQEDSPVYSQTDFRSVCSPENFDTQSSPKFDNKGKFNNNTQCLDMKQFNISLFSINTSFNQVDDQIPCYSTFNNSDVNSINLFPNDQIIRVNCLQPSPKYISPIDSSEASFSHFAGNQDLEHVDSPASHITPFRKSRKPLDFNFAKECKIIIRPISFDSFQFSPSTTYNLKSHPNFQSSKSRNPIVDKSQKLQYRSIFACANDERIFLNTSYIQMMKEKSRISKREMIQRAKSSIRFSPVLDRLIIIHQHSVFMKL